MLKKIATVLGWYFVLSVFAIPASFLLAMCGASGASEETPLLSAALVENAGKAILSGAILIYPLVQAGIVGYGASKAVARYRKRPLAKFSVSVLGLAMVVGILALAQQWGVDAQIKWVGGLCLSIVWLIMAASLYMRAPAPPQNRWAIGP